MGRILIHPEVRVDIRNLLTDPPDLDELLISIEPKVIKFALRDATLVAAIDGEYDEMELALIKKLAAAGNIDDNTLREIFDWVSSGLNWHNQSLALLEL
jgi:hypothetical protein